MGTNDTRRNNGLPFFIGLIAGSLAGFAIGMLVAPHSGPIMRRKIIRSAGGAKDQVLEALDDLNETSKGLFSEVKRVKRG